MSTEEVGVYILLLCEQHQSDDSMVRDTAEGIARLYRCEVSTVESVLAQCFKKGPRGGYYNSRLRSINKGQADKSAKARVSAKAPRKAKPTANAERALSERLTNQNQSQNHKLPSPSLSTREAGVETEAGRGFYEFWAIGGKGPLLTCERAYYNHVPRQIEHTDIVKAFTAYKSKLDGAHEMNTANWVSQKGYADTTLFKPTAKTAGTPKDPYFDEVSNAD